jgi:hypothetical protein
MRAREKFEELFVDFESRDTARELFEVMQGLDRKYSRYFWKDPKVVTPHFDYVGKCTPPRRTKKEDERREVLWQNIQWFCDHGFPEFQGFTWPSRESEACQVSLAVSAEGAVERPEPEGLDAAVDRYVEMCDKVEPPSFVRQVRDPSPSEVYNVCLSLRDDSNAGYPYCVEGKYKRDYAIDNFAVVYMVVCLRLRLCRKLDLSRLERMTAEELVQIGLQDAYYTTEKWEPLKLSKKDRQRNIVCGSVVDEIIDRLMDSLLNRDNIKEYGVCPSMVGLGFDEVSVQRVYDSVSLLSEECGGAPLADSDVTNWEFALHRCLFRADARRRHLCYGLSDSHPMSRVWLTRAFLKSRKVYVFSDGVMWAQRIDGKQPSGQYNTSSTNSCARVLCAMVIGSASARAAGDDCIEQWLDDAVRKYWEVWGLRIKEYHPAGPQSFEFCSQKWSGGEPIPLNAVKAFYKLISLGPDVEKYKQVITQFRLAADTRRFVEILDRAGWPLGQEIIK